MRARFLFAKAHFFSSVSVSYLEAVGSGVMPPAAVEVWGGEKENQLRRLGTLRPDYPRKDRPRAKYLATLVLPDVPLRYVRIIARNKVRLPDWHPSAKAAVAEKVPEKGKSLLLIDEISFREK